MTENKNIFQILAENKSGLPLKVRRKNWHPNSFFLVTDHEEIIGNPPYYNNPRVYGFFCRLWVKLEDRLTVPTPRNWEIWEPDSYLNNLEKSS